MVCNWHIFELILYTAYMMQFEHYIFVYKSWNRGYGTEYCKLLIYSVRLWHISCMHFHTLSNFNSIIIHTYMYLYIYIYKAVHVGPMYSGFFPGGLGVPPIQRKFCQSPPPHPTLVPIFGPRLVPPAEVRPRKVEKFEYIFVSNLTTSKLKSTLKSCISCLK